MTTTELANLAGVSQATVSRVINGAEGVSPETIQTVRRIIQERGYKRPFRSRGRPREIFPGARSRTGNLALLFLDASWNRHPSLAMAKLRGVQQTVADMGLNLIVGDLTAHRQLPPLVARGQVDGVLLWGHTLPTHVLDELQLPLLWLSSHADERGDGVLMGNELIGRLAAKYLLDSGHRHLAFLSVYEEHPGYRDRGAGFAYAIHSAGAKMTTITGDAFAATSAALLEQQVGVLVDRWRNLPAKPTGLFIPDDQITAIVYRALQSRGISPGEDVQIVSCNNEEAYLTGLHPRPATIDLAPETTGRRAVEQLIWRIRHPKEERRVQVMVEPVLVPGEDAAG